MKPMKTLFSSLIVILFWINVTAQKTDYKVSEIPVDYQNVLATLVQMQINQWSYTNSPVYHLGPTPQDFYANFSIKGQIPDSISALDMAGVALTAIKALAEKNQELTENQKMLEQAIQRLNEVTEQALRSAQMANDLQVNVTSLQMKIAEMETKLQELDMQLKQK
jgi:hypothetical protein